jgi:hypothetical protein
MQFHVPCTALGLALVAAAPAAQAQALIGSQPVVTVPAATTVVQPVRTVRTVTTVRTVRQLRPLRRRRVSVTRRTYVTDRFVPATTTMTTVTAAPAVAAGYPGPLYDYVSPAPVPVATPYYREPVYDTYREPFYNTYREPLYDTVVTTPAPVAPAPAVVPAAAVPAAVGTDVPFYRYVYQPDRILVIDPNTGVAVQAIPR